MENEILFIECKNEKIVVHTMDGIREGNLTDQLEFILGRYGFENVYGSTIVNMAMVTNYKNRAVMLKNGTEIKVSKRKLNKILTRFDKKGNIYK